MLTVPVCREHGEKRLETVINAEVQFNAYGRLSVKTKMKLLRNQSFSENLKLMGLRNR